MSQEALSIDEILIRLLKSLEDENAWDVEAYAMMGLELLNSKKDLNSEQLDLHIYLNWVLEQIKEIVQQEQVKKSLIEEIVNFRG